MARDIKTTKVIICCAGEAHRWNMPDGTPKHLMPILGEPLLHRTVRQLQQFGFERISIAAYNPAYEAPGAVRYEPQMSILPNTGIGHSAEEWDYTTWNLILLGDVCYTNGAMRKLAKEPEYGEYSFYGRFGPNPSTGCDHGEIFALAFAPSFIPRLLETMSSVQSLGAGRIQHVGGWHCYRHLQGFPLGHHRAGINFVEIYDLTEDFDTYEEFLNWKQAWEKQHGSLNKESE